MKTFLALTMALLGLSACGTLGSSTASPGALSPTAICGPAPDRLTEATELRMAEIDAALLAWAEETRPMDVELIRRRYLEEPLQRRDQIRACHGALSASR